MCERVHVYVAKCSNLLSMYLKMFSIYSFGSVMGSNPARADFYHESPPSQHST